MSLAFLCPYVLAVDGITADAGPKVSWHAVVYENEKVSSRHSFFAQGRKWQKHMAQMSQYEALAWCYARCGSKKINIQFQTTATW